MTNVLFLCTGNSCRSQMADGFARAERGNELQAASAGVLTKAVDPLAIRVMAEVGVDISGQRSKLVGEVLPKNGEPGFDYVITLCDHAHGTCPAFPGQTTLVHRPFDDPPRLALELTDPEAVLAVYRRVRDEIREYVAGLPGSLPPKSPAGSIPPPNLGL